MKSLSIFFISSLVLIGSCTDEGLAKRRAGLKWEKDQKQAQEHRDWDRPTRADEEKND